MDKVTIASIINQCKEFSNSDFHLKRIDFFFQVNEIEGKKYTYINVVDDSALNLNPPCNYHVE
ncbi:hypothetical protein T02_15122 [Trichinella nativa]|uniref:Uncharacterized protein n=1 Tax=Trichinella nativa TaxID=6335 RepID=A0A0V1LUI7_9BILA|nr:hypothetical protein T02_15122 [Trichinella nativa]